MRNPFLVLDQDRGNPPAELRQTFDIMRRLPPGTHAKCACGMYAVGRQTGQIIFCRLRNDPGHLCDSLSVYYEGDGSDD